MRGYLVGAFLEQASQPVQQMGQAFQGVKPSQVPGEMLDTLKKLVPSQQDGNNLLQLLQYYGKIKNGR